MMKSRQRIRALSQASTQVSHDQVRCTVGKCACQKHVRCMSTPYHTLPCLLVQYRPIPTRASAARIKHNNRNQRAAFIVCFHSLGMPLAALVRAPVGAAAGSCLQAPRRRLCHRGYHSAPARDVASGASILTFVIPDTHYSKDGGAGCVPRSKLQQLCAFADPCRRQASHRKPPEQHSQPAGNYGCGSVATRGDGKAGTARRRAQQPAASACQRGRRQAAGGQGDIVSIVCPSPPRAHPVFKRACPPSRVF